MKIKLVFLIALWTLAAVAFARIETEIPESNRVILLAGNWTPSKQESSKALIAIQSFLEKPRSTNDRTSGEIKKIREHAKRYRVQFIGVIRGGEKVILCNFLPAAINGQEDEFSRWKQYPIQVEDGGFWFWKIEYDPRTEKCSDFSSNGDA